MKKCLYSIHIGGAMNKLFEPVYFDRGTLFWDYRIHIEHDFKGYYHWHQCCEFVLVHEGQGKVVVNQQTFPIKRGMFFFFTPYQLHQVYADVSPEYPYVRSIFYADPLLIEKQLLAFPSRHSRFQDLWQSASQAHAWDLGGKLEGMEWIFDQYDEARQRGKGEELEELTLLFLQMVNRMPVYCTMHGVGTIEHKDRRKLRYSEAVMRWIEEHFHERVSMDRLAGELHLSKNYLSRVFREETGSSITDYLTARRIKHACRLLETTDESVDRIGSDVGFENSSYFIHLFKRVVGMTPLKYRRK
jgi:AraC-like DNA-binding protein